MVLIGIHCTEDARNYNMFAESSNGVSEATLWHIKAPCQLFCFNES